MEILSAFLSPQISPPKKSVALPSSKLKHGLGYIRCQKKIKIKIHIMARTLPVRRRVASQQPCQTATDLAEPRGSIGGARHGTARRTRNHHQLARCRPAASRWLRTGVSANVVRTPRTAAPPRRGGARCPPVPGEAPRRRHVCELRSPTEATHTPLLQ